MRTMSPVTVLSSPVCQQRRMTLGHKLHLQTQIAGEVLSSRLQALGQLGDCSLTPLSEVSQELCSDHTCPATCKSLSHRMCETVIW